MTNTEKANVIENVLNSLSEIEIRAKYSKTYFECFNALKTISQELRMEGNNGTNTNK